MCSLQKSAVHTAEVEAQQNEARKRVRQQNKKRQEGEMKMTLEALNSTTQECSHSSTREESVCVVRNLTD